MENYLSRKQEEMIQLLEKLVNIDSGSYVKKGVDQIGDMLKGEYQQLGFTVEVYPQVEVGNHLSIYHPEVKDPAILIVAHMDTVFPDGTAKERPFSRDEDRAYGPGVIDMKGSLVQVLYAIKALKDSGSDAYKHVHLILNSDEEIGSITSRPLIEKAAQGKEYALIVEPARRDGSIVSSRKGVGIFTIEAYGRAAHAGVEPEKGRSAINALAHKIPKLHALTNYDEGITVNVGLINGGISTNTIAPQATCQVDVRVETWEQGERITKAIREICATSDVEGTCLVVKGGMNRPPMEKTKQVEELLALIKTTGQELGIEIKDTFTGGGSDGSFTAGQGVCTIDGLGPVGGNAHNENEYLELHHFTERTLLLANVINKLSQKTRLKQVVS
ncbi:peptidase M20 [Caldalkalibacillus thermarum TA2.A1]|uniref:M20 family metallopeptidase n=1 Tax=Caldalkalibacillus thermarum (strain TA2.A1) TaxID=986075 RepID=F5LA37_CALTT|nr:M20 family metallopeptidase [Caldalkalibacillus thermarum]EGL81757.1 peptidase M20 [Caldalkalibacillus thermarum TA2.A1]QZT34133.1 M20 family metallopeptidase [Caldalkalibacillus thermarum TA2.A1]